MPDRSNTPAPALNSAHWGAFEPVAAEGRLVDVEKYRDEPTPPTAFAPLA